MSVPNQITRNRLQRMKTPQFRETLQMGFWIIFLGLLLPLTMATSLPEVVILILIALAALGTLWVVAIFKFGIGFITTPLDLGLLLLLSALIVSAIFSLDPSRSWPVVWQWAVLIILFYMTVTGFRIGAGVGPFTRVLIGIGALYALFGLFQFIAWIVRWYAIVGWPNPLPTHILRISGLMNNPNHLPAIVNVSLLLVIARLTQRKKGFKTVLYVLVMLTLTIALFLTRSRAGWISLVAGLVVLIIGNAWIKGGKTRISGQSRRRVAILIIVIVLASVSLLLLARPDTLRITENSQFSFRLFYWKLAKDIWGMNPLVGSGPNTYLSHYLLNATVPYNPIFREAHSFTINALAEMGLIGFASIFLLTAQFILFIWRSRRHASLWNIWVVALLASLTALVVNGVFDTPTIQSLILTSLLTAVIISQLQPTEAIAAKTKNLRNSLPLVWVVVLVVSLATGIIGWRVLKSYTYGLESAGSGDWNQASMFFQEATDRSLAGDTASTFATGFSLGIIAENDTRHSESAITAYESGVEREPGWSINYANLASLYWHSGLYDAGIKTMRKAISLAPDVPVYHLNLGLWYSVLGDTDSARRSFDTLKGLTRTPAQSIFWNSQFFNNVEASNVSKGAESLIERGYSILFADPAEALSLFSEALAQKPDSSRAKLASGIALLFLGNRREALEALDDAANNSSGEEATIISLWRMIASGEASRERLISAARFSPYSGIITPGFGNSYSVNAFSIYSIEALFLPQLHCFAVSPQADLHLVLMEEWFIMNSDMRLANDIRQLLKGEETGLSSCLLVDNDS